MSYSDGVDADHACAGPCQNQKLRVFLVLLRVSAGKLGKQAGDAVHIGIAQKKEHQHDHDEHGQQREKDSAFIPQVLL